MNSIRDIAKSIIAEMEGAVRECNPTVAQHYKRLALIDYAQCFKNAHRRSPEINERVLQDVYMLSEKAISLGVSEESMDESMARIRNYWINRLMEESDG